MSRLLDPLNPNEGFFSNISVDVHVIVFIQVMKNYIKNEKFHFSTELYKMQNKIQILFHFFFKFYKCWIQVCSKTIGDSVKVLRIIFVELSSVKNFNALPFIHAWCYLLNKLEFWLFFPIFSLKCETQFFFLAMNIIYNIIKFTSIIILNHEK